MNTAQRPYRFYFILFYVLAAALYLFLPTQNHSVDAWGYAASVKYGQELFAPHHLLYNATLYVLHRLVPGVYVMLLCTAVNGLFAVGGLLVLGGIFRYIQENSRRRLALLAIAAFSFGYWRYATENETYIIPIFFSLLGSLYFIRYLEGKGRSDAFLSGLFAAAACLYHQMHFFWWLGLWAGMMLYGERKRLAWLFYLLPAVIVPLGYVLVQRLYFHVPLTVAGLLHFVFHDYYAGNAGYAFRPNFLLLGAIGFFRAFLQMHGSVFFLLKAYPAYWIPAAVTLICILFGMLLLLKHARRLRICRKPIFLVHLAIFILQLAFAVYSVGNAEFMIMLPALACILLACMEGVPPKALSGMALGLFSWNLFLAVWPAHHDTWSADIRLAQWMIRHPEAHVIATEDYTIANYINYETGRFPEDRVLKSPPYYLSRGRGLDTLRRQADSILQAHGALYTDYGGRPELMSRASMLKYAATDSFFAHYHQQEAFRLPSSVGPHIVFRLSKKEE